MSLNSFITLGRSGLRVSPFCLGTMTFWRRPWMGRQCQGLGNHDCHLSGARRQFHRHRQCLHQRPFREDHRPLLRKEGEPGSREKDYFVIDELCAVAEEVGATPAAVALAWVWSRPGVESTIIGARRPDQLQANLDALDLILTDAQMAQLNEVSKPVLNFPADINNHVAPMFGFPGTTIDGYTAPASPMLSASANRY